MLNKMFFRKFNNFKEWFVLQPIFIQVSIIILFSLFLIVSSSFFIGSIEDTYTIFVDPASLFIAKQSNATLFFSLLLMIVGVVILSFVVSVLTTFLEEILRDIRLGKLNFLGENHTVIVNYNETIFNILEELNHLYSSKKESHEVVLLLHHYEETQLFLEKITSKDYNALTIRIRIGDLYDINKYKQISILDAHSLIILNDQSFENDFLKDNHNLKIINTLYQDKAFKDKLEQKRQQLNPMKIVVVFSSQKENDFGKLTKNLTNNHFFAITPKNILNSLLNISMIDVNFYNIWSLLLSFESYQFYFLDPKQLNVIGKTYREIVAAQQNGILFGISRANNGDFDIQINVFDTVIQKSDWLIFAAKSKEEISLKKISYHYEETINIEQPADLFQRNILIVGEKRVVETKEFLDFENSIIHNINPSTKELLEKEFFSNHLNNYDIIILNLENELIYRIALYLRMYYNEIQLQKFVFLVEDTTIASQIKKMELSNVIISNQLLAKYVVQVANQISLHKLFQNLFVTEDAEINTITLSNLDKSLQKNIEKLKFHLAQNNLTFIGTINKDHSISIESSSLENAKEIVVISTGEV